MDGVGTDLFEVVLVLGLLVLACRWVFGNRGIRKVNARPDYGLLVPVLRSDTKAAAEAARLCLEAAGLRATVAPAGRGFTASGHAWPTDAHVVLVFPSDLDRASELLHAAPSV